MIRFTFLSAVLMTLIGAFDVRAEELPREYREAVNKGLDWLAKQQHADGHWEAMGGQYPLTMTALSGMAMLMEGSTIREGKYAEKIRKAVDWFMARPQPNGMIGNPNVPGEAGRYMYGHGFALLFLSSIYGEEDEGDRRRKLEEILTKAVEFSGNAQTSRGGWGYVSSKDGSDFDEGSVTVTQVQAVRAARNAGIKVPKEIIDKAIKYLKDSTVNGGVIYSLAGGGMGDGRPALTAAAIACGFSAGEYKSPLVKQWFKFCQTHIPVGSGSGGRLGFGYHDEYTHYYYAQSLYMLGDEGESGDRERMTWSKYRKEAFANLLHGQAPTAAGAAEWLAPCSSLRFTFPSCS